MLVHTANNVIIKKSLENHLVTNQALIEEALYSEIKESKQPIEAVCTRMLRNMRIRSKHATNLIQSIDQHLAQGEAPQPSTNSSSKTLVKMMSQPKGLGKQVIKSKQPQKSPQKPQAKKAEPQATLYKKLLQNQKEPARGRWEDESPSRKA